MQVQQGFRPFFLGRQDPLKRSRKPVLYPLSYEGVSIAWLQGFLGDRGRDVLPACTAQRLFRAERVSTP